MNDKKNTTSGSFQSRSEREDALKRSNAVYERKLQAKYQEIMDEGRAAFRQYVAQRQKEEKR